MVEETYRGWTIEPAYIGWQAVHPDYDGPGDARAYHDNTRDGVKALVDEYFDENPDDLIDAGEVA